MIPFSIVGKDFDVTEAIHNVVFDHVRGLERYFDRIKNIEVTLSEPHRSQQKGRIFQITLKISIPGPDIIVSREPAIDDKHENFYVALGDAFLKAKLILEEQVRMMRGNVKHLEKQPHARVRKIFAIDGYGFIETPDGREIYFHENSLLGSRFSELTEGVEVRFNEEMGDKGPQVTSMHVVGKSGHVFNTNPQPQPKHFKDSGQDQPPTIGELGADLTALYKNVEENTQP